MSYPADIVADVDNAVRENHIVVMRTRWNDAVRQTLRNLEKVRADTRLQAVHAAKTKAGGMLKELGEKLGPVLEVRENPGSEHNANRMMLGGTDRSTSGPGDTFAAGVIEVKISVYTTFAIR